MTHPFRPDHTDADELNTLLDAMRSGSRGPEASHEESGELARTARQFRRLADRAASAAPAPARTFDAIWEDMMSAHAITAPTPVSTGTADRLDDTTHRIQPVREMPRAGWLQSLVSAAILAILLAGMIAAAWNLRDGNGGGSSDPGEDIRLAAPGVDVATPEATATASSGEWWTWPRAEECTTGSVPFGTPAVTGADGIAWSWDESRYIPFSRPSAQDAGAVAKVARALEACKQGGGAVPPLQSSAYRRGDAMQDPNYAAEYWNLSREISKAFPVDDPSVFVRTTTDVQPHATPSPIMRQSGLVREPLPFVYIPDQAVQLPDGRIGIPASALLTEGQPATDARLEGIKQGTYRTNLLIFANEAGEWLYDGELTLCIGKCDWLWEQMGLEATPAPSPEASTDWTSQVTAEECAVEPMSQDEYATIMREQMSVPEREYAVVGTPVPDDAIAAASVLREHEACANDRQTMQKRALESPYYVHITNGGTVVDETPQERRMHELEHGEALSAQFPNQDPMRYVESMDGDDMPAGFAGFVYRPDDAVQLSDGRIAIPATKLFGTLRENPDLTTFALIVTKESGEWRVDESLSLCVGECEAYWSEARGYQGLPASPVASPVATPEG